MKGIPMSKHRKLISNRARMTRFALDLFYRRGGSSKRPIQTREMFGRSPVCLGAHQKTNALKHSRLAIYLPNDFPVAMDERIGLSFTYTVAAIW